MNLVWSFTKKWDPRVLFYYERREKNGHTQFVPPDRGEDADNLVIPVGVPLFPSGEPARKSSRINTRGPVRKDN